MSLKRAVVVDTVDNAATQDITESNAGFSSDVKAVIVTANHQLNLNNVQADGRFMLAAAGSNSSGAGHLAFLLDDAVVLPTTSIVSKYDDNNDFYEQANVSAPTGTINSWISEGVKLNWTTQSPTAYYFGALLLGGDIEANVVHAGMGGTTSINVSHGLSGAPEVIIAWGNFSATPPDNFDRFTFGFWANNTHTGCSGRYENAISPSAAGMYVSSSWISGYVASDGSVSYYYTISNVGASTFTLTNSSQSTSQYHSFLCMRGTSTALTAKTGIYTTPTSSGNASMGLSLSTAPAALIMMPNRMTVANSGVGTDAAGALGIVVACNRSSSPASQYFATASQMDVGVTTTATDRWCNTGAIRVLTTAGGTDVAATINAWQSDDIQLNFSTPPGTAQKWPYLVLGMADAPVVSAPQLGRRIYILP